jgi:hypothetical protein
MMRTNYVVIDMDELKDEVEVAYEAGNYRYAGQLMTAIDTIEVYGKPELPFPGTTALFNEPKTPLVKKPKTTRSSPKVIRWSKDKKMSDLLVKTLVEDKGTYEDFRRLSKTKATDSSMRTRMYVLGYRRPNEDGWVSPLKAALSS